MSEEKVAGYIILGVGAVGITLCAINLVRLTKWAYTRVKFERRHAQPKVASTKPASPIAA
jgi:hypothetical protein